MIELVALDIAGTTVQEHQAVYGALADAVVRAGGNADAVHDWMGASKREAIAGLLGLDLDDPIVGEAFADFRRLLAKAYADTPPQPMLGVPQALATLRARGIKVALTTGFDREVTTGLLATLGWDHDVVDAVICIDDVSAGRPAPYLIFRAMEATGVRDVAHVLVAGDTLRDLEAGTAAGAGVVVGVLTGGLTEDELRQGPHTHILPSAADLPELLSRFS